MSSITLICPHCDNVIQRELAIDMQSIDCDKCGCRLQLGADRSAQIGQSEGLRACLVCPSTELFVRKDFPQRLGAGIVVLGFALSCVTWFFHLVVATFAILFGTAMIDLALYLFMGDLLECYRCHAQYRGLDGLTEYGAFDLEIHERHRQQKAVLAEQTMANR